MKDWIIKQIIGLQLPKLLRQGLAILGTYVATHGGGHINVDNIVDLITGVALMLISVLWSYLAKRPLDGTWLEAAKGIALAIARQANTVMASWLAMDPAQITNGTITTSAIAMAVVNVFISAAHAPDGSTGKGKPAMKVP